jgi:hypothetical protein
MNEDIDEFKDLTYNEIKNICRFEKKGIPHKRVGGSCDWCYYNRKNWYLDCNIKVMVKILF